MSRCNRLRHLAVGGCLIAGILLTLPISAQEHNSGDQPKSPQSSETKEQAAPKPPPGSPDGEQPVKTDWSNPKCDQPQNHDEADLCEQRRMAKAAEDTVSLNRIQTVLGVAGAALLFFTLYYTRRTVRSAEDTAERQLRAYVTVEPGGIVVEEPGDQPRGRITARNVGSTPAYHVEVAVKCHIITTPHTTDITDDAPIVMAGDMAIVPSGHRIAAFGIEGPIGEAEFKDVFARRKWITVFGYVKYRDAFDNVQRTRFCHLYQGQSLSRKFVRYHKLGNSAT